MPRRRCNWGRLDHRASSLAPAVHDYMLPDGIAQHNLPILFAIHDNESLFRHRNGLRGASMNPPGLGRTIAIGAKASLRALCFHVGFVGLKLEGLV